jgi:RNA-splicing ligase RtcB
MIDGNTLIGWGFTPGRWFGEALAEAQRLEAQGADEATIYAAVDSLRPPDPIQLQQPQAVSMNVEAANKDEQENIDAVEASMRELMRTPTIQAGAVMPDACPAGPPGTIPVGGIVATDNALHPGMHSADICCSVAISVLGDVDPAEVLDRAQRVTHFGGGGRPRSGRVQPPMEILSAFSGNGFLAGLEDTAIEHFATQGDGNHFLFVGRLASTGEVAVVTHHGSRKPGAQLYKRGMAVAERYRKELSPDTLKQNAWIPADSEDGRAYWHALQTIREWTKTNHFAIHDRIGTAKERWWNEHNFVFARDGRFYHGKGATPAWADFAADTNGLTLIPLNMAQPVLITRGSDAANGLGFCPHGAGRNFSRSEHGRRLGTGRSEAQIVADETPEVDVRFYSGHPDVSELPSAYKDSAALERQIHTYGLAEVIDRVEPYGCIMAGDWKRGIQGKRRRG